MRKIIAYKGYFNDFLQQLSAQEQKKLLRALDMLLTEDKIPRHYIKYIRDGIYELRVNYGHSEFRIFFIYDGNTIVVLLNCLKKKTQKLPNDEINKAIKLKHEYHESKRNK
ncbi:MAG: type II toxin-antitoxin system RelE/ParE family toxin [Bacteroides sp.]|nr:type II toxin-antitoxin system RelE/ParE family toxin [Bacteroides sp.]